MNLDNNVTSRKLIWLLLFIRIMDPEFMDILMDMDIVLYSIPRLVSVDSWQSTDGRAKPSKLLPNLKLKWEQEKNAFLWCTDYKWIMFIVVRTSTKLSNKPVYLWLLRYSANGSERSRAFVMDPP